MRPYYSSYYIPSSAITSIPRTETILGVAGTPMGPVIITAAKPNRFRKFKKKRG